MAKEEVRTEEFKVVDGKIQQVVTLTTEVTEEDLIAFKAHILTNELKLNQDKQKADKLGVLFVDRQ